MDLSNQSGVTEVATEKKWEWDTWSIDELGKGFKTVTFNNNGGSVRATYTGMTGWSYRGKAITKAIYDFQVKGGVSPNAPFLQISQDPTKWFSITNGSVSKLNITYYYGDGSPVSFAPKSAYLTVGSLNNYANDMALYSIEEATVLSGGTPYALYGSSVGKHGNSLYSATPNTILDKDVHKQNPNAHFSGPYKAADWDINGSPNQYYGAGIIEMTGTTLSLEVSPSHMGAPVGSGFRDFLWFNGNFRIPDTPGTSISYHYNVANAILFNC